MGILLALDALYVQVRRIHLAADERPRLAPIVAVAAALYPTIAAAMNLVLGQPQQPALPLPSYFRIPQSYVGALLLSALIVVWVFDRRRSVLDARFPAMPTINTMGGFVALTVAATAFLGIQAYLSAEHPTVNLALFLLFLTGGGLFVRKWQ